MSAATVVITTFSDRRIDLVESAVSAAVRELRPGDDVLVVVDHNEPLYEYLSQRWRAKAVVTVLRNRRTRGLSGARNTGLVDAASEVVVFLDDDAEPQAGWLAALVAPYADGSVVATGGRVVPESATPAPAWWPSEFDWVIGCSHPGLPADGGTVRNPIGANMSVRRDRAIAIGGFSDTVGRLGSKPLGCEETDLCIRLVAADPSVRVVYAPASTVKHNVSPDRFSFRYFASRCYAEGISKARVARRVGRDRALASERSYATRILPHAVGRSMRGALKGEAGAASRALAIGAGLGITAAGYVRGAVGARSAS